jgi:glycine oxidase
VEQLSGHRVPLRTRAHVRAGGNPGVFPSVSVQEIQTRIPGIRVEGRSFWWSEETSLDPRDLCVALPLAASAAGAILEEGTEVLAVRSQASSVEVTTSGGTFRAGAFVNCCGAWAGEVRHLDLESSSPAAVEPRKGQIFAVQLDPPLDLAYALSNADVYLVPRGGGRIVIGGTVERVGFDRRVDADMIEGMRAQAAELWPPISSARVVESWSGIRPGTIDGLPLIGSAGRPHCWVATGHFRNGILLAPATALVIRQLLEGRQPSVSLTAFAPDRASDKVQSAAL